MVTSDYQIMVQQIIPPLTCQNSDEHCAENQLDYAIKHRDRNSDRFEWKTIALRHYNSVDNIQMEPGENQAIDFEFMIPLDVKVVRVYSWFHNDLSGVKDQGWPTSSYYVFDQKGAR